MTGSVVLLLVVGLVVAVVVLAARYGADSRPGVDRPPEGWWPGRA